MWVWTCVQPFNRDDPLKTHKKRRVKLTGKKVLTRTAVGKYALRLFVAGATVRSRLAILCVRKLCATELKDNCTLEVIDIYQQPHLARVNQIVATPTLIKDLPPPVRRFIGNLSNPAVLFAEMDLNQR